MTLDMKIFSLGITSGLEPNELVYLIGLYEYETNILINYGKLPNGKGAEIKASLIEKGWIDSMYNVTSKFEEVFYTKDSNALWLEFKAAYPRKCPDGRRLHLNLKTAEKKYKRLITTNKQLHEEILTALNAEIRERRFQSSLNYMSNIATYINQENWNAYLDEDGNEGKNGKRKINIL
jgi:hypothetical protein